jgi:DNA repair exonuclease SbcCD ATPase subunit
MSEDVQEIERLIKQSAEFSDSLIRLARKLQEQNRSKTQLNRQQAEDLSALHAKLTDLQSHIDVLRPEIVTHRYDHLYAKARHAVAEDAATPQEAVIHVLQAAVADKTMTGSPVS